MVPYANLGGNSGVAAYETGPGYIKVQFHDYSLYLYTNGSAGAGNIAQMHGLAAAGRGLNSFINTNVKRNYESKLR